MQFMTAKAKRWCDSSSGTLETCQFVNIPSFMKTIYTGLIPTAARSSSYAMSEMMVCGPRRNQFASQPLKKPRMPSVRSTPIKARPRTFLPPSLVSFMICVFITSRGDDAVAAVRPANMLQIMCTATPSSSGVEEYFKVAVEVKPRLADVYSNESQVKPSGSGDKVRGGAGRKRSFTLGAIQAMLTQTSGMAAQHSDSADDNNAEAASVQEDDKSSCCIGCFRLLSSPPELPPEGCDENLGLTEPELLCASCIHHLAGKNSKSLAVQSGAGVLSPLPKLSLLVKAEAKCQDQLQQLRSQQEMLKQQRASLEATKRAKEEALTAERELARQRRKHFLMIQERRKREEEAKLQQFQSEEHTSRSEQGNSADKKKKKPKPPKVEGTPLSASAAVPEAVDVKLPHVELCTRFTDTPSSHNNNANTAETHSTSFSERRRQMMACYSQDLAPLIDGRKPRRLPFPKPVAAIVPSSMAKKKQAPDNNAQTTTLATHHRSRNQPNSRQQGKPSAPKTMKLRPLEEKKRYIQTRPHLQSLNNQFEDFQDRENSEVITKRIITSPLSLQPPSLLTDHSAPLTAEIKPVSWAFELTKDILPQEDLIDEDRMPLHPVTEEEDDRPQFTMFPLQHQLPTPTFPPSKPEPPVEMTTKVPRWEYSTERLSSLLEKYNVSVSAVTAATSVPNL